MIDSIAALKRALVVGATVRVTNFRFEGLNGVRTVLKAQTNSWCMTFPPEHPNPSQHKGSWLSVPKRANVRFDGGTVTFLEEGTPWLTLTEITAP